MSTAAAAAPIAPTLSLTPEQAAAFHRDGFLAVENISTVEEVGRLREIFARLFAERAGRERGDQFDLAGADDEGKPAGLPQILGPSRFAPELKDTLYHANGLAISKQLWGEEQPGGSGGGAPDGRDTIDPDRHPARKLPAGSVRFGGDHTILKPAGYGKTTPWHQDEAYWDPWYDSRGLSIWMPLQAATIANGCMWYVPGSHLGEILPHRSIGGDTRVHGLELLDDRDARARGVPVELPVGGAVLHHCRTLHYAGPNTTDVQRHAYIIGYHAPGTKRAERRHVPWQDAKQTPREARARAAAQQQNVGT